MIYGPLLSGKSMFKFLDQGWLEVLGGQGVFSGVREMRKVNQVFQSKLVRSFIRIMVIFSILVLGVVRLMGVS